MFWKRLLSFFRYRRLGRELEQEIAGHLALQEEEFRRQGMEPGQARAAALREFGGVAQAAEEYREQRGVRWMEMAWRDMRYAARGLARNPGFTAAAVLSLALGIGANTAIFSLFHTLMLNMLPVANPRELVYLFQTGAGDAGYASPSLYLELQQRTDLFAGVLARRGVSTVRLQGSATARVEPVSTNYFDVLGMQPALGRYFRPGERDAAVLSYAIWQNRYNADPEILGRAIATETGVLRVIGVASRGFVGVEVESPAELWTPLTLRPSGARYLWLIARLKPGVSRAGVGAALDALMANHQRQAVSQMPASDLKRRMLEQRIEVRDGAIGISFLREQFGRPLSVLFGLVLLVLLATCANIAHLLVARGAARTKEIAVRCSLGASPARLIGEAMAESLLLAALGCAAGILLANAGGRYLLLFLPAGRGTLRLAPDGYVLAFAVASALASALIFGLIPAIRSAAIDPVQGLKDGGGRGRPRLGRALVSAQVALSTLLVAMAGLFVHSLAELRAVNLGFSTETITFWLDTPRQWKAADEDRARTRLLAGLAVLPGVASVSYGAPDLLQGGSWRMVIQVPGDVRPDLEDQYVAVSAVGPRFIETVGGVMAAGREIALTDTAAAGRVAVVNEAFSRKFLGGPGGVLGRTLVLRPDGAQQVTVVGVVRDLAQRGLRRTPDPAVYVSAAQFEPPMGPSIVVRGSRPAAALLPGIRAEVARLGSGVSLVQPATVRQRLDDSIFQDRILAALSAFFGALALVLAAVGLYGVVAYTTRRRAGEIGIRMALGASRRSVLWLVVREALTLVAGGLLLGLPLALAGGKAVGSLLFGVPAQDPVALAITAAALVTVGLLAALAPARRATSLDPLRVLRVE